MFWSFMTQLFMMLKYTEYFTLELNDMSYVVYDKQFRISKQFSEFFADKIYKEKMNPGNFFIVIFVPTFTILILRTFSSCLIEDGLIFE